MSEDPLPWDEPPYAVPSWVAYRQVRQVGEPLEDGAVVLVATGDDTRIWYRVRTRLVVILCPTHSYRDSWATRCLSASCAIPPP